METKTCLSCDGPFSRPKGVSGARWAAQTTCSRHCAVVYRKQNAAGKQMLAQGKASAAIASTWRRHQRASERYIQGPPPRLTREDELAAIERFAAERGVTRAEPVVEEVIQDRQENHRPTPMSGWRE